MKDRSRLLIVLVPCLLLAGTVLLVVPLRGHPLVKAAKDALGEGYGAHFLFYLLFTLLALWFTSGWRSLWFRAGAILLAAHAVITEWMQRWVPTRNADLLDLTANLTGIAAGCLLLAWWRSQPAPVEPESG